MATSSPIAPPPPATPRSPGPGSPFPRKAALAAVTATALLYGWHRFRDPSAGLSPSIFGDAASLHLPHSPAVTSPTQPLNGVQQTAAETRPTTKPGTPPPISDVLIDDRGALDPFFAALYSLESHSRPEVVTILHYGDSPTTADLITGDARAMLQERFGDAGHGFNLVGKPWAWYGHRDVAISDHGWRSLTGVGAMRQSVYGLGGATLVGGPDARSTFKLTGKPQTTAELQYLTEPGGGSVTLSAGDTSLATISTDGPSDTPAARELSLPAGASSLTLSVSGGQVKLLGIDFRTGQPGVLYDSLGLNGASTTVLSRTLAPGAWAAELEHARPSLVIINYGTNESGFGAFVRKQYEGELRLAVANLRKALPRVPILIMSPMDRGERGGLNEIHTMATIPEIVAIQKRVAADLGCAFFDTFDAMGGDGTMARWYAAKPRLISADLIHPTPQGAVIVAQQLVTNLGLGYDRWKRAHKILLTPASPPTTAGSAKPGSTTAKAALPSASTAHDGRAKPSAGTLSLQPPALSGEPSPAPEPSHAGGR